MTQFEQRALFLHFVELQKAKHLVLDLLFVGKQVVELVFVLQVVSLLGQVVLANRNKEPVGFVLLPLNVDQVLQKQAPLLFIF